MPPPRGQALPLLTQPYLPLNLNLAGALARQHQVGHLHLGLVGLQREVSLGEQLGGTPDVLMLQALLEVLRNLKGSDCGQGQGQELQGPRVGPNSPKTQC